MGLCQAQQGTCPRVLPYWSTTAEAWGWWHIWGKHSSEELRAEGSVLSGCCSQPLTNCGLHFQKYREGVTNRTGRKCEDIRKDTVQLIHE